MNWFANTILITPCHQGLARATSIQMRHGLSSQMSFCTSIHISGFFPVSRVEEEARWKWRWMNLLFANLTGGWLSRHRRAESHVWIEIVANLGRDTSQLPIDTHLAPSRSHRAQQFTHWKTHTIRHTKTQEKTQIQDSITRLLMTKNSRNIVHRHCWPCCWQSQPQRAHCPGSA